MFPPRARAFAVRSELEPQSNRVNRRCTRSQGWFPGLRGAWPRLTVVRNSPSLCGSTTFDHETPENSEKDEAELEQAAKEDG